MKPVANFATSFASVGDTGGKFATGVNDTGSKILLPVSTTPVAIYHWYQPAGIFATGVNDTGGK